MECQEAAGLRCRGIGTLAGAPRGTLRGDGGP